MLEMQNVINGWEEPFVREFAIAFAALNLLVGRSTIFHVNYCTSATPLTFQVVNSQLSRMPWWKSKLGYVDGFKLGRSTVGICT